MKRNALYVFAALLLLFVASNPTPKELRVYLGRTGALQLKEEFNFYVCSQYSVGGSRYLGIAGHFFKSK
jgi:hypothetical protein